MGRKPCCSKEGLNRGAWNAHEDKVLVSYIKAHGEGQWGNLPIRAGLKRCGKSCRLRWLNYLRPDIKRGNISDDEEDLIIRLHKLLGNRWSLIAGRLPGRTDNEIKNYWNTTLAKRVQGRRRCKLSKARSIREPDGKKDVTMTSIRAAATEAPTSGRPLPPQDGTNLIRTKATRCTRNFFYQRHDAEPPNPAQATHAACNAAAGAAIVHSDSRVAADDEAAQLGRPHDQLEAGGAADPGFYTDDVTIPAVAPLDVWMENYWCFQPESAFNAQSLDLLLDPEDPYWSREAFN